MTRRSRTRAAVALADIMAEWEQEVGEKVARGRGEGVVPARLVVGKV